MTNTERDLVEAPRGPILTSQGGFPYNGEWIKYWERRAIASETALASIRAERDAAVAALKQCSNIFENMYRYGVVYTPPDDGTPHLEPVGAYYLGAGIMPMIARAIAGEQKND